jgi:uncharacterized protein (DUF488 family)
VGREARKETFLKVYTMGYSGWNPDQLLQRAEELDAVVLDIRIKPYSRNPAWTKSALQAILGERYVHAWGFGNMNYKGGPVALQSFGNGIRQFDEAIARGPVILMCMCRDYPKCHRSDVIEAILRSGREIEHEELAQPAGPGRPARTGQKSLFE